MLPKLSLADILNLALRVSIIILGVLALTGVFTSTDEQKSVQSFVGVMMIAFGTYRLAMFLIRIKQKEKYNEDSE
jgi:cytochrome c biogenesis protein CcdA